MLLESPTSSSNFSARMLSICQPNVESKQLEQDVEMQREAEQEVGGRKLTRIMKRAVVAPATVPDYMKGVEDE